jgi:hypothetical protein
MKGDLTIKILNKRGVGLTHEAVVNRDLKVTVTITYTIRTRIQTYLVPKGTKMCGYVRKRQNDRYAMHNVYNEANYYSGGYCVANCNPATGEWDECESDTLEGVFSKALVGMAGQGAFAPVKED